MGSIDVHATIHTISAGSVASRIEVSCDRQAGGHGIAVSGLDAYTARQMQDRLLTAFRTMCITLPAAAFSVRLVPAVRYDGQQFDAIDIDLPVALCVLAAGGIIDAAQLKGWIAVGSLDRAGRIGSDDIPASTFAAARRARQPVVGGNGLMAFDWPGQTALACASLADALHQFRHGRADVHDIGGEDEADPQPGFWTRLAGRVAEASAMAFFPEPRARSGFGKKARRHEALSPEPVFHGNGHRGRLRARLVEGGPDALADYEVLEFMLFGARRKGDTKPIAKALIQRFGSLPGVLNASPAALMGVPGVGPASVGVIKIAAAAATRMARAQLRDIPVLGSWNALIDYLSTDMAHLTRERVRVLYLDSKNKLIRDEHISEGTINEASVHPREVIHHALDAGACGLILVHNHPSGDPEPSRDDIRLTNQIAEAGRLVGVAVLDHVIIGRDGHVSLRAKGLV